MNLEQTAASMREQFPNAQPVDLQRQEKLLEKFRKVAFGGFGVVVVLVFLGLIYIILDRMIFSGIQPYAESFSSRSSCSPPSLLGM